MAEAKININAHKGDSQERQVMTGSSDANIEPYTVENRKTESYSIGWFDTRIKRGKVDPAPVYQRSYIREGDEKFGFVWSSPFSASVQSPASTCVRPAMPTTMSGWSATYPHPDLVHE